MSGIKGKIDHWCSAISAASLTYNITYNYFFRGYSLAQSFILDPIGYITTFLPVIVGIVVKIANIIQDKYVGSKIVRTIFEPIVFVGFSALEVYIIFHFNMNVGFNIEPNSRFLIGILVLVITALLQAFICAVFEGENTIDIFSGRTIWVTWLILSLINGANEASLQISNYVSMSSTQAPVAWLCITVICTLLFFVWLVFYAIIIFARGIITGFSS